MSPTLATLKKQYNQQVELVMQRGNLLRRLESGSGFHRDIPQVEEPSAGLSLAEQYVLGLMKMEAATSEEWEFSLDAVHDAWLSVQPYPPVNTRAIVNNHIVRIIAKVEQDGEWQVPRVTKKGVNHRARYQFVAVTARKKAR
jgi:hypothetical protein